MDGAAVVARARTLIGVRFRPQGRSPSTGVDCIGLVAEAFGVARARADYRLAGGTVLELERELAAAGFQRSAGETAPGDVLLMRPAAQQLHLGIWTGFGVLHADARLGRVVERPGPPLWPVLGVWRMEQLKWRL